MTILANSLQPYFNSPTITAIEEFFSEWKLGEHIRSFLLRLLIDTRSGMAVKAEELLELELLRRLLAAKHTELEAEKVLQFLKGFCMTAQIYIVELFIRARIYKYPKKPKKTFADVIAACVRQNELVWKHSSPGRYADPDDVTTDEIVPTHTVVAERKEIGGIRECIGARNANALAEIYTELGVPFKGIH